MDQDNTPPPPPRTLSYPAGAMATSGSSFASSSSSASPLPVSSSMPGQSPSAARSHRRFHCPSPPYPPPAAPLPGHLATGSGSSSRLRQIPPPWSPKPPRRGRPRSTTNALPSPFLSELLSIRSVSASLFANLGGTRTRATTTTSMSCLGTTASPAGSFSEFALPLSTTGMPPMSMTTTSPATFSGGSSGVPLPPMEDGTLSDMFSSPPAAALQPQPPQDAQPSFADLVASRPSGRFFPVGYTSTPCHNETNTFGSSSWSTQQAQTSTMVSSDPPRDLMSFSWQHSGNNAEGTSGVMQPAAELGASMLQTLLHTPPLLQVKEEPIDDAQAHQSVEPVVVSLDDDDYGLSAILKSFTSSNQPPSLLPRLDEPVFSHDMMQLGAGGGSSSSRPCARAATSVEGSQKSREAAMTQVLVMYDKVNTARSSIPWNCDSSMSMSQEQAPSQFQQQPNPTLQIQQLSSAAEGWQQMNSSDGGAIPFNYHTSMSSQQQAQQQQWQPTQNNTSFVQQQANNQQLPLLPAFTDMLQLNSSSGGSNSWNCEDSMSMTQPQLLAPQQGLGQPNNTFPGIVQQEENLQIPLLSSFIDNLQQNNISCPGAWSAAGANSSRQGWAAAMPSALCNNYSVFGTNGDDSSSSSALASMPWNLTSSSMEYSNALTNLGLGVIENPSRLPPRPPSFTIGAGPSSSTLWRGAHGDFFSEADMEAISKDKILKKIVSTDPQRVKRILHNRVSVAKLNAQKINRIPDLQRTSEELQMDHMQLSTQVLSAMATTADLNSQNSEMQLKMQMLNEQASLNEAVSGQLQPEIQRFAVLQFNMLGANGTHDPMRTQTAGDNGWYADGLYPLENSNRNDLRGSHLLPTDVQPPQHEQQLHQATDDEFVMRQQQKPWNF